jgi:hypothetical protein
LADLKTDLPAGRRPDVTEPKLLEAAVNLVSGMSAAGVRRWNWLPAPNVEDLVDPAAWAAQRLAAQRTVQDETDRIRLQQQKLARAQGQRPAGNGTINPVHLQNSSHDLDELARRLKRAMSRKGFERRWLDPRSDHYVHDRDGGIANKQVLIMANMIAGRQARSFDDAWKIAADFCTSAAEAQPQLQE